MKDWQKGIELDKLLTLEKTWERYNERCLSPFLEMKKNKIANAIDLDEYQFGHEWAIQSRVLKAKSKINMYTAVFFILYLVRVVAFSNVIFVLEQCFCFISSVSSLAGEININSGNPLC